MRIATGLRSGSLTAELSEEDQAYFKEQTERLEQLEKLALKDIKKRIKRFPIYPFLLGVKGIGPTLSGVICSEIDITRCETVSALWRYSGLSVNTETNHRERLVKGEKAHFNKFLKTKIVGVAGDVFLRVGSPYRTHYDNYKHRKQSAGWGESDGHRHRAAIAYMMKMFLLDLWKEWRALEGLVVTPTYAEAVLKRTHGDHGGMGIVKPTSLPIEPEDAFQAAMVAEAMKELQDSP